MDKSNLYTKLEIISSFDFKLLVTLLPSEYECLHLNLLLFQNLGFLRITSTTHFLVRSSHSLVSSPPVLVP